MAIILRHFSRGVLWWLLWGVSASCIFERVFFVEYSQLLSPQRTTKKPEK